MKYAPVIEVNQPRQLKGGRESQTHRMVLDAIHRFANDFGIQVRETARAETSVSVRPSIIEESAKLCEEIADLHIPKTVRLGEFRRKPFFPMMLKMEKKHRSKHKYLIETQEQFAIFEGWLKDHGNEADWICQQFIDCRGDSWNSFRVIACATGEIFTSQVIYGAPKGMDLRLDKGDQHDPERNPAFRLENPDDSDYFLNARSVASNRLRIEERTQPRKNDANAMETVRFWDSATSQTIEREVPVFRGSRTVQRFDSWSSEIVEVEVADGSQNWIDEKYNVDRKEWRGSFNGDGHIGGRATLDRNPASHPYSKRERKILADLDLDDDGMLGPSLPADLKLLSGSIARELCISGKCVRELFLGIDFIKEDRDGDFYLVEVNRRPLIGTMQDLFGGVTEIDPRAAHVYLIRESIRNVARNFGLQR